MASIGPRIASLRWRALLALCVGTTLGLASLAGLELGLLGGYRLQVTDALQPTGRTDERVVVVAVDGRSLAQVGERWPWPRSVHAELVRNLAGSRAVVYDVLFSLPSSGDDELAQALSATPAILSSVAEGLEPSPRTGLFAAEGVTLPVPALARQSQAGHSNVIADPTDGVVRSLPLLVDTPSGDLVPSMALATLMHLENLDEPFTVRPASTIVGDRVIPTGRGTVLEIAFSPELRIGVAGAPILSAVDVIEGRIAREQIEGKVVFVGATDPALGDERPTPVAKSVQMPGVLIHANALNTLLTHGYLEPAGHVRIAVAAGILAALLAFVTLVAPVSLAPIVTLATLAGYVLWTFVQFDSGVVLDLVYPPGAMALAFVSALGIRYFTELRGRRRAAALFAKYVPKTVADDLLASGRLEDAVNGERLVVTALFCDLRGFTATSAKLEPGQVRDLLNIYYEETSRLIHDHEGTLLTYVGDEVFGTWGAPMPDPDGASKAVACARAMQDAAGLINQRLDGQGLPSISYGIGLHTGEVIAAHVGSEVHRQYTILGDAVNCASRLCTIAGRTEIVVSAETYKVLKIPPPAETLPGIALKGVGRELLPHRLWPAELRDPTGEDRRGKVEA